MKKQWSDTYVTWEKNTPSTNWSNRGGDFTSTPLDSASYNKGEIKIWLDFDISDEIKDLHQNQENNFGFLLKAEDEGIGHNISIRSSETSAIEFRPKLVVTCEVPNEFSPAGTFICPEDGDTLTSSSDKDSVHVRAFDQDIGTTDGSGIASVSFALSQNSTIVDSITVTGSPFVWEDFDSEDYLDGEYTLRATIQSLPAAGGTSSFEEIQVYIKNGNTKVNKTLLSDGKTLKVIKRSGEFLLNISCETLFSVTITDILGRQLASFQSVPGKKWYSLPQWLPAGVHVVTVGTEKQRIVRKIQVVR